LVRCLPTAALDVREGYVVEQSNRSLVGFWMA